MLSGYSPMAKICTLAAYEQARRALRGKTEPDFAQSAKTRSEEGVTDSKQKTHPIGGRLPGYSPGRKFARLPLTSELALTAVRSRSRENNIQLFSYTLAPLRYALCVAYANPATSSPGEIPRTRHQKKKKQDECPAFLFLVTRTGIEPMPQP